MAVCSSEAGSNFPDLESDVEAEARLANLGFLAESYEETSSPFAPPTKPKRRILIAEDDDEIRGLMVAFLEAEGYSVLSCGDSFRALQIFQEQNNIELVIADIYMPRMLGTELAERLTDIRPDIPIFLVSGADPEDRLVDLLRQYSQWKFFHKPFFLPELLEAVHEIMDNNLPPSLPMEEQAAV